MKEKVSADNRVREIRRKTRKKYSSEEKVRIVLEGLRGEESIAALCRREGIPSSFAMRLISFSPIPFAVCTRTLYGSSPRVEEQRVKAATAWDATGERL